MLPVYCWKQGLVWSIQEKECHPIIGDFVWLYCSYRTFFGTLLVIFKRLSVLCFGSVANEESNSTFNFLYLFSSVFLPSQFKVSFCFYWFLNIPLVVFFPQNFIFSHFIVFIPFHISYYSNLFHFNILYILFANSWVYLCNLILLVGIICFSLERTCNDFPLLVEFSSWE